jgi:hypothetical protein
MQTAPLQPGKTTGPATQSQTFPALDQETRSHVDTACAAFHLNRRPQTMRVWATYESGLLRPVRINGRLAWSVADIKCLLSGGARAHA